MPKDRGSAGSTASSQPANRNCASASTKRRISHADAVRSRCNCARVVHFIVDSSVSWNTGDNGTLVDFDISDKPSGGSREEP
ncbi:hypothetical protein ACFFX0_26335 [Citricoccus parietis]|uniref:Uncharacterized protein n=1 Tax=Citricoccus parietis TaxID=592307 RepID=A0ABV5G6G3_9MICC